MDREIEFCKIAFHISWKCCLRICCLKAEWFHRLREGVPRGFGHSEEISGFQTHPTIWSTLIHCSYFVDHAAEICYLKFHHYSIACISKQISYMKYTNTLKYTSQSQFFASPPWQTGGREGAEFPRSRWLVGGREGGSLRSRHVMRFSLNSMLLLTGGRKEVWVPQVQ